MDKTEKIDILNGANCKVILNGKDIGNYQMAPIYLHKMELEQR